MLMSSTNAYQHQCLQATLVADANRVISQEVTLAAVLRISLLASVTDAEQCLTQGVMSCHVTHTRSHWSYQPGSALQGCLHC